MRTYQQAGVDLSLGSQASQLLYQAAHQTWHNRQDKLGALLVPFDDYSGLRAIDVSGLPPGTLMNIGFDGVGTKVEIAERVDDHSTIAFDLFAMVCDDAAIRGAEPVLVGSILDVNRLQDAGDDLRRIRQLTQGYVQAAKAAGVAVINGEVAELGGRVAGFGPFAYNWGAAVVWFARRERLLTGEKVRPGDHIVALQETGFRSNGLSLAREVLATEYGEDWHLAPWQAQTLGEAALQPSRIYSPALVAMTGGFDDPPQATLHAAAHITGGGIPEKLARALKPSGYGAQLDDLFAPPALMLHCQERADIDDEEAYRTWHMGQGMLIITPAPQAVIRTSQAHNIEARVVGKVMPEPGISLRSQGACSPQASLSFPPE